MKTTVMDFLNLGLFKRYEVFFKPFKGEIVKVKDESSLWELASLPISDEAAFFCDELDQVVNRPNAFLIEENELYYLRRINKQQAFELSRLRNSLEFYRDSMNKMKDGLTCNLVHAFMPKGFCKSDYLSKSNSTPYRRSIANSLFLLDKRGYTLPEDVKAFMNRYKTKKTTRR